MINDGDTCQILLTRGRVTIIDAIDYDRVSQYRWTASLHEGRAWRAQASFTDSEGVRRRLSLHRFILDAPKGTLVDHRNGNPLDNRRSNLRFATPTQNSCNRRLRRPTHGFKGIFWFPPVKRFGARIMIHGKSYFFGYHATAEAAARAYDKAAIKLHGEFASLNFPEDK